MKRGVIAVVFVSVMILSLSFASASWFGNFFGKITGGAITGSTITGNLIYGDSNQDSVFNANDVSVVKAYLSGTINITKGSDKFLASDVNGDGFIGWNDLKLMNNVLANRNITAYPIQTNGPFTNASCTDSDGGEDYFTQGNVNGLDVNGNPSPEQTDYCVVSAYIANGTLREFYCNPLSGTTGVNMLLCPNGCLDGACKIVGAPAEPTEPTCIDYDGENYYNYSYIKEQATGWARTTDTCVNSTTVEERVCSNGVGANKYFACSAGCVNGACREIEIPQEKIIIEEDISATGYGTLSYLQTEVLRDNCELMEIEKGIDARTCDSYRGTYKMEGAESVEVVVEVRRESFDADAAVASIIKTLEKQEGVVKQIERTPWGIIYILHKPNYISMIVWASGDKIILLSLGGLQSGYIDELFEGLAVKYLLKYPSSLQMPSTCEDSDGGLNYYTKGIASRTGFESTKDFCASSTKLSEALCNNDGKPAYAQYDCPNGCADGACISEEVVQPCTAISSELKAKVNQLQDVVSIPEVDIPNIIFREGDKITYGDYVVVGDMDESYLLKLFSVKNASESMHGEINNDYVKFRDELSGTGYIYQTTWYKDGVGTISIGGKSYGVTLQGNSASASEDYVVTLNYPVSGKIIDYSSCFGEECVSLKKRTMNPPKEIQGGGINFKLSGNNSYDSSFWIDGAYTPAKAYDTYYYSYEGDSNYGMEYRLTIFDDASISAEEVIGQMVAYNFCSVEKYGSNKVYVCNWNAPNEDGGSTNYGNHKWSQRSIFWTNKNMVVEINTYSGRAMTQEEIDEVFKKNIQEFLENLKNNQEKWISPSSLAPEYQFMSLIEEGLSDCPSDISSEACTSIWTCKTEPIICPPHGQQTRTCQDINKCQQTKVDNLDCSPGECSGCYIPKWFGTSMNNKCIPYGFRFAQQVGWTKTLVENAESGILSSSNMDDEIKLDVTSDTTAVLTLYEQDGTSSAYELTEGETTEIIVPDWDSDISSIQLTAKNIVYDSLDTTKSYVEYTAIVTGYERTAETFNAYCDVDGVVKVQKVKESSGSWAKCQNNYECESNLCSGGDCIEINDMIKNAKGYKKIGTQIICKLADMFGIQNYEECIAERLG